MLEIKRLSKSYNGKQALNCVCEYIKKGETVSIIGPSGCGKSTFLRCLSSIEQPDEGSITLAGENIVNAKGCVGLVCAGADEAAAREALNAVQSAAGHDKALLFDEPSVMLAPFIRRLAQSGITAIIATSSMELARALSGRVIFMDCGCIAEEGSPEELLCRPQLSSTREFLAGAV